MSIQFVTVFGGSSPKPGEPAYQEAQRLGMLLGKAGFTVLTGGYIGTMEAVSRGAAEAGSNVIGVTCEEIEAWRPGGANAWVTEERRFSTLRDRLFSLIDACHAAIALPGGPGTLAEISLMWNQMVTQSLPPRPLILVGPGWRATFESFFQHQESFIPPSQRELLKFSTDVDEAFVCLQDIASSQIFDERKN
jgi:uncharacterized protein (TIGR00730 family)